MLTRPLESTPPTASPENIAHQYGDVAAIYDALMIGVPHSEWLSRIERAARQRGKAPRSALDVACGTGIATSLLYQRGYRPVCGVDISPAMVTIARTKADARGQKIDLAVQDAAELDLGGRTFDLAISLFDSLNYILDPARLQAAFRRVHAHLTPGGVFAFDMNSTYALATNMFTQTTEWGPLRHAWRSHWDPATKLCRVEMDFWVDDAETGATREFHETHIQRAYTVPEIKEWLAKAGFVALDAFGNYGDRAPGPRSDRLLFVAERGNV